MNRKIVVAAISVALIAGIPVLGLAADGDAGTPVPQQIGQPLPRKHWPEAWRDRQEVRGDRRDSREDRQDLRQERSDLRQDHRELRKDRRAGEDLTQDKQEIRKDRRDIRDVRHDRREYGWQHRGGKEFHGGHRRS